MSSFIDKLNERLGSPGDDNSAGATPARDKADESKNQKKPSDKFNAAVSDAVKNYQFNIDIIQSEDEILIHAPIAGADPLGFEISIDRENDIITIKGTRKIPTGWGPENQKRILEHGKYVQQECKWEPFFRKVILPSEVEVFQSRAYFENGVLILHLPVLKLKENKSLNVVEITDGIHQPNIANEK